MKALRFRIFLIALVALAATFLLASFATPMYLANRMQCRSWQFRRNRRSLNW